MIEYLIISAVALFAAGLTFFSGFGLGTLLLPAFALFFPAEIAVGMTAVVHLCNNLFKLILVGKNAEKKVVLKFGIPAIIAAFFGAKLLVLLAHAAPLYSYTLFDKAFTITATNLAIGGLMVGFAILEWMPSYQKFSISTRWLPLGGLISGFFGGLSGHQGALRTVFLLRTGLSKEAFIATGVVIACLIDISRLFVYWESLFQEALATNASLILTAMLAAFIGAYTGNRLLKKITMKTIQIIVSVILIILGMGMATGII
jgi:hypothetical protein